MPRNLGIKQLIHRRNMINLENMLKTRTVDLYRICGSETFTPPYLPPAYFSRFVTPYLKEITGLIHKYGGLARIHCHGKTGKVLDDIISCGADAFDPCEAPPDGDISLRGLKERAGGKDCLFCYLRLYYCSAVKIIYDEKTRKVSTIFIYKNPR